MKNFLNCAKNFLQSEDGPTAVEYAVMVALIAVIVIAGAGLLGNAVNTRLSGTATAIGTM